MTVCFTPTSVGRLHQAPPLRAQEAMKERMWKDGRQRGEEQHQENSVFEMQQDIHALELSGTVAACTRTAEIQARWVPALTKRCLQLTLTYKGKTSFLQRCLTGYSSHIKDRPHAL